MTDYEPSDELVEMAAKAIFAETFGGTSDPSLSELAVAVARDNARAAIRAIAPILIKEGMERAAKVVDARVPLLSEKQANAFAGGNGQSGYLFHAKHCEALDIASAIRAAKEG